MTIERAAEIVEEEQTRRRTMRAVKSTSLEPPKTCTAGVVIDNKHNVNNGKIQTDSSISARVEGSVGTISVKTVVKATDPTTKKLLGKAMTGEVPGQASPIIHLETVMNGDYSQQNPHPTPTVEVDASCKFIDGQVVPATVTQRININN